MNTKPSYIQTTFKCHHQTVVLIENKSEKLRETITERINGILTKILIPIINFDAVLLHHSEVVYELDKRSSAQGIFYLKNIEAPH